MRPSLMTSGGFILDKCSIRFESNVILHLKSNTAHKKKAKVRSLFESIGYSDWDGPTYAMFPIYDCVSVPTLISKVTSQLMEAVDRKHQYELRAEIEELVMSLETQDLPRSILQEETQLLLGKIKPRKFSTLGMEHCHLKIEEWYRAEKEFFNLQYNQKSIRIRRRKKASLYESLFAIEKILCKEGYAMGEEVIVRGGDK